MLNLSDLISPHNKNLATEWWRAIAPTTHAAECPSCGRKPCASPSFCAVCLAADQKAERTALPRHIPANWDDMSVSLEALHSRFNERRGTPEVTVEAIMYCVRQRGVAALKEPVNVERLLRCDERTKAQINKRIAKLIAERGQS
jgi:hypothetical protein